MASPLTLRSTARSSVLRDSDGDDLRGVPAIIEEEIVTEGLFKAGLIPLVVRLSTGRTDRVVTRDVRTLGFRSTIPGGFASCEVQLDRPLSLDPDEIQLYGDLYIYDGRNGATIWQGRMEDRGRGAGRRGEVWTVRAVGPAAHARDRTVKLIYVDKSLERWFLIGESSFNPNDPGGEDMFLVDAADTPGLRFRAQRGVVVATGWRFGRLYRELNDAGQDLARVSYDWDTGATSANWRVLSASRNGIGGAGTVIQNSNFNIAGGSHIGIVVTDFPAGDDILELAIDHVGGGGPVASDTVWGLFSDVVVVARRYDRDGNLLVPASPYVYLDTVLASEVAADLLGRLLDQYDGPNASIEATTFAIEQLAYSDGVTPEKVLADLIALEPDFYWAAWEGSPAHFEWRSWPTSIRYEADAKDGFMSPASAVELYNRVTVRWRSPDGRFRVTVRTATVDVLDAAGLTREALINMADEFGTAANAQQAGDEFLAEHSSAPNAGTLSVSTPIFGNDQGREVQPWEIRPGHLIRVRDVLPRVDALNATARDAVTVFKIVAVDYNADNNTARLELDSQPRTLAGLLSETELKLKQLRKR